MAPELYKASAPGSLMILGEHAVLRKYGAIVTAIDKRITVELIPRTDEKVIIESVQLGNFNTSVPELLALVAVDNNQNTGENNLQQIAKNSIFATLGKFDYVISAMLTFAQQLPALNLPAIMGCNVRIDSEFSSDLGFGSSAACVVATISALARWQGLKLPEQQLFAIAKAAVYTVAGAGSGADLAASIWGGTLYFRTQPFTCERLPLLPELTAIYSGSKITTPQVIKIVERQRQQQPELYDFIFKSIDLVVEQAVAACKTSNWQVLGKLFTIQQGLMAALGVSTPLLDSLTGLLTSHGAYGAKISGAGLGDCVIGLGEIEQSALADVVSDLARSYAGIKLFFLKSTPQDPISPTS